MKKHIEVNISHADLMSVASPGRYVGGETNVIIKNEILNELRTNGYTSAVRVAFGFPDVYEIGMSNLAMQILYKVLNEPEWCSCERAFSPWPDMDKVMRDKNIPLYTLETKSPLNEFDVVCFSIGYEMAYTNVLQMLDLGGVPLKSADRTEEDPIVVCGGPVAYNIEPMADFFDAVFMGEGEEVDLELAQMVKEYKDSGKKDRQELLRKLASIEGVYVPSLYKDEYDLEGHFIALKPIEDGIPTIITKRIIKDLDGIPYPTEPVVPNMSTVHNRAYIELFRGCIRGCRFCQAGYIYRPVREKSAQVLCDNGIAIEKSTGYDELGLLSLSTSDYRGLPELTDGLLKAYEGHHTSLSLPSLRIDNFAMELMNKISSTRKSGITFAPEAGTQRLRDVINKGITEEDILKSVRMIFEGGWSTVKLYFMLGLPTETMDDVKGIADLAIKIEDLYYDIAREKDIKVRRPEITISTSLFIPKPFTAFQWEAQDSIESLGEKQRYLKSLIQRHKSIHYNWHGFETSVWEAVLARGDRRMAPVILDGYKQGCIFDAWDDMFKYETWLQVLADNGLTVDQFIGAIDVDAPLAWDHINIGVTRKFLALERKRAYEETVTPNCREKCAGCGAACFKTGVCYE
ncbi:MAG: TIGR03960 family B12-binding radical SAM protein [Saccharofermentans sp.]|nr:TIGR03960 family B12-binding radical SAM protein [Saccharofermentans sp.]